MVRPLDLVIGDARPRDPEQEARPFVVVVGLDFGHAAVRAVDVAIHAAARHATAEVHLVAVGPRPLALGAFAPFGGPAESALDARRRQLELVLATAHRPQRVRMFAHPLFGSAARAIVTVARRFAADLIILGTAGSSGPSCLLLRSVASRVLEETPCSVMTIHPPRIMPSAASAHFGVVG